jgi:integrase
MNRYERLADIGPYWVARDRATGILYVCWYDGGGRQTRRRSLRTTNVELALSTVRGIVDRGIVGDPGDALADRPLRTVAELLDWDAPYAERLISVETELNGRARIRRLLGERRIAALLPSDFDAFRDACVTEGIKIGSVSRALTSLRAALNRAIGDRRLRRDDAPAVPEYANKNYTRSVPPRARILTLAEIARLIDAIAEPHLLLYVVWLCNTAARGGAILDLTRNQIDLERQLVNLNPAGRIQTKKWRPTLPLTSTVLPWCADLPPGPLITWRGRPIAEIDTAFKRACARAGLAGGEGGYSIRHALARYMRMQGVPLHEIAVWLGHIRPPESPATTLIYSPDSPAYLATAKAAVEKFVRDIATLTQRDLLCPPWRT